MALKKWCPALCFYDTNMLSNSWPSQTQDFSSSLKTSFLSERNDGK